MSRKTLIYLGALVGSTVGGYIPSLWGSGIFSGWSILLSLVGGLGGIWLAVQLS